MLAHWHAAHYYVQALRAIGWERFVLGTSLFLSLCGNKTTIFTSAPGGREADTEEAFCAATKQQDAFVRMLWDQLHKIWPALEQPLCLSCCPAGSGHCCVFCLFISLRFAPNSFNISLVSASNRNSGDFHSSTKVFWRKQQVTALFNHRISLGPNSLTNECTI